MVPAPPVRRRLVGRALRRYRENLGYSLGDAAAILECDASKLSRIETGQRGIRAKELRELAGDYGIEGEQLAILTLLADPRGAFGWHRAYEPVLPGAWQDYLILETAATRVSAYEAQRIPALLQTPAWAEIQARHRALPARLDGQTSSSATDRPRRAEAPILEPEVPAGGNKQVELSAVRSYCARMGALPRFAQRLAWLPYRFRRASAMPGDWPYADNGLRLGIHEGAPSVCTTDPESSISVTYSLGLDIGEFADGCRLIVRSISLTGNNLIVDWAFAPEPAEEADLWPEIRYGADVSPRGWNQWRADFDVFEWPVPKARQVWFDFFQPYYEWYGHSDRHGQPDDDYLRNRVARITLDLKTGAAQIET